MDADTVAAIKAQADIAVDEYVADFSGDVTVNSITYLGDYLLVAEDNDESEQNIYGLVYKINSFAQASVAYEGANVEQYYYIQFDNIVVNEDGTCEVDLADYYTPYWQYFTINLRYGEFAWLTNYYTFYGYEDFDAMKLDFEDVNDAYSCEWNVSENGEV